MNSKHARSMNDLSLKGCEELKTEIVPNSAFWAVCLCPASEFSSCICVATCVSFWLFFSTLSCHLSSTPSLVPVAPSSLVFPTSDCSLCRRVAYFLSHHSASMISGLTKRGVSKMFVLSAAEGGVTVSGSHTSVFLYKC